MSRCPQPTLKLLTIAILAVLPALSAYAGPQQQPAPRDRGQQQDGTQNQGAQDRSQPRDNSSLSDAVRRVERDTRGEVLSAERVQYDGRDMHRVKVVDDEGRVRVFMQDPNRRSDNNQRRREDNSSRSNRTESNRPSPSRPSPSRNNDRNDGSNGNSGSQRRQRPTRDEDE